MLPSYKDQHRYLVCLSLLQQIFFWFHHLRLYKPNLSLMVRFRRSLHQVFPSARCYSHLFFWCSFNSQLLKKLLSIGIYNLIKKILLYFIKIFISLLWNQRRRGDISRHLILQKKNINQNFPHNHLSQSLKV